MALRLLRIFFSFEKREQLILMNHENLNYFIPFNQSEWPISSSHFAISLKIQVQFQIIEKQTFPDSY